jgi:hypothetical protein
MASAYLREAGGGEAAGGVHAGAVRFVALRSGRMSVTPKPRASSSYIPLCRSPRLSMSRARR